MDKTWKPYPPPRAPYPTQILCRAHGSIADSHAIQYSVVTNNEREEWPDVAAHSWIPLNDSFRYQAFDPQDSRAHVPQHLTVPRDVPFFVNLRRFCIETGAFLDFVPLDLEYQLAKSQELVADLRRQLSAKARGTEPPKNTLRHWNAIYQGSELAPVPVPETPLAALRRAAESTWDLAGAPRASAADVGEYSHEYLEDMEFAFGGFDNR